jgi:hypothetical protein
LDSVSRGKASKKVQGYQGPRNSVLDLSDRLSHFEANWNNGLRFSLQTFNDADWEKFCDETWSDRQKRLEAQARRRQIWKD